MHEKLKFLSQKKRSPWKRIKVRVLSPEYYVLHSEYVAARIDLVKGGFKLRTKYEVRFTSDKLLGPRIREAHVYDVEFCFTEITLSAKRLGCKNVPCVVKEGDVVRVC